MNHVAKNSNRAELRVSLADMPTLALDASHEIETLTAALAARDSFNALIGHELRNSIAPIVLLVDQLADVAGDPALPPLVVSRLTMLIRHLRKLTTAIDRVAEVADLRRGKLALELEPVDLVDVVTEVCRDSRREAAASGSELVLRAGAPVMGAWDRGRVKQIASSLVSNAIRYGGGPVELNVRDRGDAGELVVRDHGPGIDPGLLPDLFDRFDHERGRRTGGFGVGLWVVKTLCSAMRGTVSAENCADGGARFCVVLGRG
jgi:signal transduction histidine kinase